MNKILEFFKSRFEKWKTWSVLKKIVSISVVALLFSSIVIGTIYMTKTDYTTLFSNLELADSNKVIEKLKTDKIPYKIEGNTILVPKQNVDELRLSTLSDGTISSNKGFELFDTTTFGMTDKEANVKYQRALQGELEKTIGTFDEIKSARVMLKIPEETVFSREKEEGSASVSLVMNGSDVLSPEKVKAIVALISGSVKNIPKENISVTDNMMNLLSENLFDETGKGTVSGLKQHELEQNFENKLKTELVKSLEAMFGKDKVKVNVNADLDFDSRERNSIVYDKDNVVARSIKQNEETSSTADGNTAGGTGVDANAGVNYPAGGNGNNSSTSGKNESVTNNEIGQVEEKIISAPGEVKRLTTSVMIDGKLTDEKKAIVRNMVASAIGFDSVNRQDVINVDSMIFDEEGKAQRLEEQNKIAAEEKRNNLIKIIALSAFGVVLVIGAIIGLIMWRRRKNEEDLMDNINGAGVNLDSVDSVSPIGPSEYSPVLDENDEEYEMNLEKEIRNYASKKPDQVIDIVKTWLSEDER